MSTAALILAAGEQTRWKMAEPPYYKQLLSVGNETIIERICRQCRERGIDPLIVSHHSSYLGAQIYQPSARRWTVETLLSTQDLWQERTAVLLGDVIHSPAVLDRTFAQQSEHLKVYGSQYEIFTLSFNTPHDKIVTMLEKAIVHAESGVARGGGKLRKFYQAYCGLNMTGNERESKVLNWVDDYTQDVDNPGDYAMLQEKIAKGIIDDLLKETEQ